MVPATDVPFAMPFGLLFHSHSLQKISRAIGRVFLTMPSFFNSIRSNIHSNAETPSRSHTHSCALYIVRWPNSLGCAHSQHNLHNHISIHSRPTLANVFVFASSMQTNLHLHIEHSFSINGKYAYPYHLSVNTGLHKQYGNNTSFVYTLI